jgi:nucleoside-diphosphate-sugar epimerase
VGSALVLGGSGFIGRHLVELLRRRGERVTIVARRPPTPDGGGAGAISLDVVRQFDALMALVAALRPSAIFNLTGGRADRTLESERFSFRLGRALADGGLSARLVLIGSAAEYGAPVALPLLETHPLRAATGYGFAKAVQSWMARALYEETGYPIVIARVFNVAGAGQTRAFLLGSAVAQALEVARGIRSVVDVGNLDVARDFVDVKDVARALALLATRGRDGEAYNVCAGRPVTVREVLAKIAAACGLPRDCYRSVAERRRADVPVIYGSYEKVEREAGWAPAADLHCTLREMIDDEQARVLESRVGA